MKVRDILSQLRYENPEAEVKSTNDGNGDMTLTITPLPQSAGQSISADEEAVNLLADHVSRVERIRTAIEAFYGLPAKHKIRTNQYGECVELIVKSPTGKTMAIVELSIAYVLEKDEITTWRRQNVGQFGNAAFKKFKEVPAELAGYGFNVHKYVITGEKLREAVQSLCEAPKWIELQEE